MGNPPSTTPGGVQILGTSFPPPSHATSAEVASQGAHEIGKVTPGEPITENETGRVRIMDSNSPQTAGNNYSDQSNDTNRPKCPRENGGGSYFRKCAPLRRT